MKKLTALLLAVLMLAAAVVLASCGDDNGNETKSSVTSAAPDSAEETDKAAQTDESGRLPDPVSESFVYDDTVTFLVIDDKSAFGSEWATRDIFVEEEHDSTDHIQEAVYQRNVTLHEKYKTKVAQIAVSDTSGTAKRAVDSNDDTYDVLMCDTRGTLSLMISSSLYDLNSFEGLDLSNPWWDQKLVKNCSIGGHNFFATGDISISDNDATWIMMFNKTMVEQYDLESPYTLVKNNQWTFDKMYSMMREVAGDGVGDDGNRIVDWDKDKFGFVTHNASRDAFYFAAGLRILEKDEQDMPYFSEKNNEYISKVLDKSIKLWTDKEMTWSADRDGKSSVELQEIFESGRGLFMGEVLQLVSRMRSANIDFGVIPYPKFESSQEDYGHFVVWTASMLSIPKSCKNPEKVATFVEAMAYESMYTLTPAYYVNSLTGKYFQDPESSEMLDIILKSRTFDLGSQYMFNWGEVATIFTELLNEGSTSYASKYNAKITAANRKMNKDLEAILKNVN